MRINPMLNKELKLSVRTPRSSVLLVIFNTVLSLIGIGFVFYMKETSAWNGRIHFRYSIYMYIFMSVIEFILLLFIVPTITAGLISSEREKQTLDILMTSGMKPYQIISGKLMSAAASILLIIVSGLPVIGLALIYGGISFENILITLCFLIFAIFYIGSIGIFCSSLFKKTTFASLLTYGIEIILIFGSFFIVYFVSYIRRINTDFISSDIGILSLILLFSPGVTFACILMNQVAAVSNVSSWFLRLGMPEFAVKHFVPLSITVQVIFICIFTALAVYYLKDHKHRKIKNRYRLNNKKER